MKEMNKFLLCDPTHFVTACLGWEDYSEMEKIIGAVCRVMDEITPQMEMFQRIKSFHDVNVREMLSVARRCCYISANSDVDRDEGSITCKYDVTVIFGFDSSNISIAFRHQSTTNSEGIQHDIVMETDGKKILMGREWDAEGCQYFRERTGTLLEDWEIASFLFFICTWQCDPIETGSYQISGLQSHNDILQDLITSIPRTPASNKRKSH
eukprot:TRINITY_DN6154_c0_g1_i1.p2 TRINITY_DN6154_c0_g1~~TRINITY_DN6154_c0_g1_i1.p2  ORF type:complete len:210 (-),score=21.82 TRINITY_DN6154_c0_g1_i1:22-651(-)